MGGRGRSSLRPLPSSSLEDDEEDDDDEEDEPLEEAEPRRRFLAGAAFLRAASKPMEVGGREGGSRGSATRALR